MHFQDQRARAVVRALYGPPRPVRVVTVSGEIDDMDNRRLQDLIDRSVTSTAHQDHFGCHRMSAVVVVDLRDTTFIAASALHTIAVTAERHGHPLRIVVSEYGVTRRVVDLLDPRIDVTVYTDLIDAVLADVVVPD